MRIHNASVPLGNGGCNAQGQTSLGLLVFPRPRSLTMKWAVLAARVLVGLMFTVFGANFFLKFADIPPPPADSVAMTYLAGIMIPSGYLTAVKVLEITGGILLLSGRMAPLGITILT